MFFWVSVAFVGALFFGSVLLQYPVLRLGDSGVTGQLLTRAESLIEWW